MDTNDNLKLLGALADALDCFWNAAMGEMNDLSIHGPATLHDGVGAICHGIAAVSDKLRELSRAHEPDIQYNTEQKPLNDYPFIFIRGDAASERESLPDLLRQIGDLLVLHDTLPGNFSDAVRSSLRGRAFIIEATHKRAKQQQEIGS